MINVKFMKLNQNAVVPKKATVGAAGMDLYACIDSDITVPAGETVKLGTGLALEVPSEEYAALVFARSGLSIKHGLAPANCVGLIDSDYRGEIIVGLHNSSKEDYTVTPNERIAQLVIVKLPQIEVNEVTELSSTERADGGFGSTGKK